MSPEFVKNNRLIIGILTKKKHNFWTPEFDSRTDRWNLIEKNVANPQKKQLSLGICQRQKINHRNLAKKHYF